MHEMCLSQTAAAVDEERVIGRPRILSALQRGGTGELIGFAFHEIVEGKFGAHIDHTPATAAGSGAARAGGGGGPAAGGAGGEAGRGGGARPPRRPAAGGRRGPAGAGAM